MGWPSLQIRPGKSSLWCKIFVLVSFANSPQSALGEVHKSMQRSSLPDWLTFHMAAFCQPRHSQSDGKIRFAASSSVPDSANARA